jgi:hypothetical protein
MKLSAAIFLSLAVFGLASCTSGRAGRTVELPGGVTPEETDPSRNRDFLDRLFTGDQRQNAGPCPLMGVLYDNSRMVDFAAPSNERYANIEWTAEMNGVRGFCRYLDDDPITMSLEMEMAFGRGPAATADRQTYRYWVAVVRRGFAPIEKQYFDVDVRFPRGESIVTATEEIERITIPRATPDTSGENFEILVGWELTPEQLAFNRAGKRFRINVGENAGGGS